MRSDRYLCAATLALRLAGAGFLMTALAAPAALADHNPPDLPALMRQAIRSAARDPEAEAQLKARYAFVRTRITETRDAHGELRKRTEETTQHPPTGPGAGALHPDPGHGDQDRPPTKRPYERRDFQVDDSMLDRFVFTFVGVDTVSDRAVWVVDFEPAPDAPPARSLPERFLNLTAGRLWLDRTEATLVHATFRLTAPIQVAGGLVGALKRCEVVLEKDRTPDGLWFTRRLTWQIEGRKLLSTRRMEHLEELTDLRPRAETHYLQRP